MFTRKGIQVDQTVKAFGARLKQVQLSYMVSVGAVMVSPGDKLIGVMKRADVAMYVQKKRQGRRLKWNTVGHIDFWNHAVAR